MELSIIFLCGILFGGLNFAFFCLGYYVRSQKKSEEGVELTRKNFDYFKDISKFVNYNGKE